jgi:hypothetical protein
MELRSFLSGMCFLYGIACILPFLGINITVSGASPIVSLIIGIVAIVLAYILLKHG